MKTKRTGFTLVELLVVIAIIALLMGILMPALAKVRHIAYRMVCGNNVGGIGKAMMVYANDNSEAYPVAGGKGATWSPDGTVGGEWKAQTEADAYGRPGVATITSCFYLLVRYSEMPPKQFICKGDIGVKELKLSELTGMTGVWTFQDFWDFGGKTNTPPDMRPGNYCSYSYQLPFKPQSTSAYPVTAISSPETPVCSDRNPVFDKNAWGTGSAMGYYWGRDQRGEPPVWEQPDASTGIAGGAVDTDKTANSASHQRDGQNVLFNDSHVSFELTPWCGIQKDNIWVPWCDIIAKTEEDRASITCGPTDRTPGRAAIGSRSEEDSFLVSEKNYIR